MSIRIRKLIPTVMEDPPIIRYLLTDAGDKNTSPDPQS